MKTERDLMTISPMRIQYNNKSIIIDLIIYAYADYYYHYYCIGKKLKGFDSNQPNALVTDVYTVL